MTRAFTNLSPGHDRTGRACAWIEREGGWVLMTGLEWGGWTLPGGGIHPGETAAQAALREAWEETGAHAELAGPPFTLHGRSGVDAECFPMRLRRLDPSPEGRPVTWVNPHALPWADDVQLRQGLAARGQTPGPLALPPLVARVQAAARALGFAHSCSLETGRLLRTLAAARPGGRFLELGTGLGLGSAWLLSGMSGKSHLTTIDHDPGRAHLARTLLAGPQVRVLSGDWASALEGGPYDLIFNDCAPAKRDAVPFDRVVAALAPGGTLLLDDLSPPASLPAALHAGDPLRAAAFHHPALTCTELEVSSRERVILGVRTGP